MEIFIVVFIIIVLSAIGIVLVLNYNKLQIAMIKISEAQENIDILLNKKMELITNINNIIEDKNKNKKIDILENTTSIVLNSFDLNKKLNDYNNKILELVEYNKDVKLNDKEMNLVHELKKYNNDLLGAEKYYNDNVVEYNKLVKCFPSNIVSKLFGYKLKDFYSNETQEIFDILKKE